MDKLCREDVKMHDDINSFEMRLKKVLENYPHLSSQK